MKEIPRSLVILRPRQPFLDWVNHCDLTSGQRPMTLEEAREDPEGILIPAFMRTNDGLAYVREHAKEIFETMLSHWEDKASEWPPERDFDSLRQWFDVELYSSIYDAEDKAEARCTLN